MSQAQQLRSCPALSRVKGAASGWAAGWGLRLVRRAAGNPQVVDLWAVGAGERQLRSDVSENDVPFVTLLVWPLEGLWGRIWGPRETLLNEK